MSQHERQRLWRSECVICGDEHVSVGKTHDEAMAEVQSEGWLEFDGDWFCEECAPNPSSAAAVREEGE